MKTSINSVESNMEKIIIAYENRDMINNHEHLLPMEKIKINFNDADVEVLVVIHDSPRVFFNGETEIKNFDFLVTAKDKSAYGGLHTAFHITRETKPEQMRSLYHKAVASGYKHLKLVKTWNSVAELRQDSSSYKVNNFIIKPIDGARGIGQVLFKDCANQNKATLFKRFNEFCRKLATVDGINFSHAHASDEISKALKKTFGDDVVWSGYEAKDSFFIEGLFKDPESGFFAQEFLENIALETRVITGKKNELHFFERQAREDRPFKQATGSGGSDYHQDPSHALRYCSEEVVDEFKKLFRSFGQCMSVDLFVTTDGKFGIFEYCNQYGTDVDDPEIHRKIHIDFLKEVCTTVMQNRLRNH